ncbi:MAG: hypothetical protein WA634_06095 [Silvibacterium sp.]
MTSEQLQKVRAERWRQASNPILTAEDARAWMDSLGFCLFLPRRAQFPVAAPSFVEAVAGVVTDAPGSQGGAREAIETATSLLHRLTADGAVLPLNLLGAVGAFAAAGGTVSDQPDFLVTREAMPYVFSLIGGRNWKSGPGAKASPLVLEIWKQLDSDGAQTSQEIQTALGREVTEAAVLRGLMELWNGLRAIPVYDGDTTRWELTQARFAAEMTASQKVAQATALSALVSLYLESAVAATEEEVETFLSPLTARSKVREVVNGLSATRQLGLVSVGAQPLLHVAGSLPEFAEEPVEIDLSAPRAVGFERKAGAPIFDRKSTGNPKHAAARARRKAIQDREPGTSRDGGERKPYERRERPAFDRGARSGPPRERTGRPGERTGFGRPAAGRFAAGSAGRGGDASFRPKAEGERPYRKPFEGKREDGERKSFGGERKSFGKKPFDRAAKPFRARSGDDRKPFGGDRIKRERPGAERSGGERARPSFGGGGGKFGPKKFGAGQARPWQARGEGRGPERAGDRARSRPGPRAVEGERPFRPRREDDGARAGAFGGEKKFDRPKFGGEKKFGGARSGGAGSGGARFGAERGSRPSGGFKREGAGEKRPFFRERPAKTGDGESRPRTFRPAQGGGAGAPRREGGWKPKSAGGFSKAGRPAGKSSFKSAGPGFKKTGKPGFKSGGKPGFKSAGKPGFKKAGFGSGGAGKSFGKGKPSFGKPGAGRTGKPAFGKGKPGGFKAPFRKKKDEGSKNAE